MINYNPLEHHDKLVEHIAKAMISKSQLDMPFIPPNNYGMPKTVLRTEDETYLFDDHEQFNQLYKDAGELAKETILKSLSTIKQQGSKITLELVYKEWTDLLAQTDSQPKNPPFRKLSKKQFYELVKKEPWHLFSNVYDDVEDRNDGKVIWMPLCKEPLPLEEIMELREQYKKNYKSYLSNSL